MKRGLTREQMSAYQGAMEAVLAVPIAIGFGYLADRSFDSSPIGIGVGAVIGFAAMVLRVTRMRPPDDGSEIDANATDEQQQEEDLRAPGDFWRDDDTNDENG
jgi:F0F1-type ATP synthase assembly protein I